jgi:predicted nucleic acid-binding protein
LDERRARLALADLRRLRFDRVRHDILLERCWELRDNLTIYDAAYVALAEVLEVTLVTADGKLSNAPGTRCSIEVLS